MKKPLLIITLFLTLFLIFSVATPWLAYAQGELRVVTLNGWFLPFISKDNKKRMEAFPGSLARYEADIYAFQEIWPERLKKRFAREFQKRGFPYSRSVRTRHTRLKGALGNGLQIVSRYPIRHAGQKDVLTFRQITRLDETLVKKGALRVEIDIPELGWIDFYDTHFGAVSYDPDRRRFDTKHVARRLEQARELSAFIGSTARNPVRILAGDFNSHHFEFDNGSGRYIPERPSPELALLWAGLLLFDTFHWLHPGSDAVTFDARNPNVADGRFPGLSEYVDYILVNSDQQRLEPVRSEVIFIEPVPGYGKPLSDHYGVLTEFAIH